MWYKRACSAELKKDKGHQIQYNPFHSWEDLKEKKYSECFKAAGRPKWLYTNYRQLELINTNLCWDDKRNDTVQFAALGTFSIGADDF